MTKLPWVAAIKTSKDVDTLLDFTKRCWIQASELFFFVLSKGWPKTGLTFTNSRMRADQPMGMLAPGNLTPAALRLGENTVTSVTHGERAMNRGFI